MEKRIQLRGKTLGDPAQPLICTPIIGRTQKEILQELTHVTAKKPDLIEWRADFFDKIENTDEVIALAKRIRENAGDIPVIFTNRSQREGGQPIPLSEKEILEMYIEICKNTAADIIDFELSNRLEHLRYLRKVSHDAGLKMIMSYHHFESTPSQDVLMKKLLEAEACGADIAKAAVMPKTLKDVLTLLNVTYEGNKKLNIPLITISMGGYGTLTRMFGGVFGSCVTFAVGENSSAPGQIPIEDLKTVLNIVQKSMID
ncbi:3-dehydroquinate dehydratase-1 [Scopulibacillus daqui]|uniref:3-dehydroquinate dehydratase n=1 Tax=Scopulibacillus daqui TaxID=1469162 RepID=A0ABS2Q0Y3_9BACL|nr:type I 3-dehydroquinate dehydratase [Scopulibacillus daqui]MBM7645848.1 3-dehydroquinate dehydratase-1 [Scopulibacillus daqui]